jgi:hypothetical protein
LKGFKVIKLKRVKFADIKLDEKNANRGTKRGRDFLEISLNKYGLGRSILLDKDGKVIAGNKTLEAYPQPTDPASRLAA